MATPLTGPIQTRAAGSGRARRRWTSAVTAVALVGGLAVASASASQAAPTITIGEAQAQLAALQARQDAAVEAFDQGTIASQQAARRAKAAADRVRAEQGTVSALRQSMAAFVAAAYTGEGVDPLTGLLAGGDPQSLIDKAANLDQVARSRSAALVALHAEQTRLAGLQAVFDDRSRQAAAALTGLARAKAQIQSLISAQQQLLGRLRADQRRALLAAQRADQLAASRASVRQPLTAASVPASSSSVVQTVLAAAYSQRGKPYVYGAAGPNAYDCSGLVLWAFAHAGISLPHSAAAQYGYGTHIPPSQLQPGDIVFYNEGGTIGHNGIYVGNGMMIDANHTGGWVDVRPLYSGLIGGTRL